MEAAELVVVFAVLVGMTVQAALGFGFAFFVAPAAFAAFDPPAAVALVALLAIAINLLVLFAERRVRDVAGRAVAMLLVATVPGMLAGVWLLGELDADSLQLAVGVVVLAGAAIQARGGIEARPGARELDASASEVAAGLAAGALTTSVSVNGPVVVLALSRLGLRGGRLRDSIAATLLGLGVLALPVLILGAPGEPADALPDTLAALACLPALLAGHRLGARTFARLDEGSHYRAVLVAASLAGAGAIAAALI